MSILQDLREDLKEQFKDDYQKVKRILITNFFLFVAFIVSLVMSLNFYEGFVFICFLVFIPGFILNVYANIKYQTRKKILKIRTLDRFRPIVFFFLIVWILLFVFVFRR